MDKSRFFVAGGIGSFAIYGAVIALLIFTLTHFQTTKKIAIKSEQTSIEISVEESVTPNSEPKQPAAPTPTRPIVEKKQEEPKRQKEVKIEEDAISPKKIIKEIFKKEPKKESAQTETKKQPNVQQEQPKSAKELLSALSIKKNADVSFTSFNQGGEVNEYLSNIAKIIKQGWNPIKTDAGMMAVVIVNIEPDGSFTFKLKHGGSVDFNDRLTSYLKSLQAKRFPPPTDKKAISVEFNFKARE